MRERERVLTLGDDGEKEREDGFGREIEVFSPLVTMEREEARGIPTACAIFVLLFSLVLLLLLSPLFRMKVMGGFLNILEGPRCGAV